MPKDRKDRDGRDKHDDRNGGHGQGHGHGHDHGHDGHGDGDHGNGGHGGGHGGDGGQGGGPVLSGNALETFLACARQALGGVYCSPSDEPRCTDCSGLVRRCYLQATQRDVGGDSHEQFKLGTQITRAEVQPGDLLFWDTQGGTEDRGGNTASHVGIASGGNRMLNALSEAFGIRESDLSSPYWTQTVIFLGARRLEF